jgi:hypothetical protein
MLLIHRSTPGLRGVRLITMGYATSAAGMELLALRGRIPDFFSITIANSLLVLINVFLYWGIADLLHLRRPQRWLLPASALPTAAISLYFSYVRPDISARIIGISALAVAQYALIVHLLSGRPLCGDQHLSCMGGAPARPAQPPAIGRHQHLFVPYSHPHRRHDRPRRHLAGHGAAPA